MAQHIEFNTGDRLPVGGSNLVYGTAELRTSAGYEGNTLIALGTVESCSIKDTGDEEELPGEEGALETFLMLNEGKEASITVRFTRNVAAPRKGWFIGLRLPETTLTPVNENYATPTTTQVNTFFLITNVTFDWGNKSVRKYTLTAKRWESLNAAASPVAARINTATGAIVAGTRAPAPYSD